MSSPNNNERKIYLPLLWEVFLDKIDEEWKTKYTQLGSDRFSIQSDSDLATAIDQDIRAVAPEQASPQLLTATILLRYLRKDGLPTKMKEAYLQNLLTYCGYLDWQDFKESIEADETLPQARKNPPNSFRDPWFYLGPVILLLLYFSFQQALLPPLLIAFNHNA